MRLVGPLGETLGAMSKREIVGSAFPHDTGEADPRLHAALAAYDGSGPTYVEAVNALANARVLVPVVAVLGEVEYDEAGLAHDKTSDMATVLMTNAAGEKALLAFSSTETLARWDPQARPVPVWAIEAAKAAIAEGAVGMVVDIAGPAKLVLEGYLLAQLAAAG